MLCDLPVVYFAIFVFVCKVKHLFDVFFHYWHWKVSHHELKVSLGEELVLDLVFLRPEVCWVWICSTYYLQMSFM